MADEGRWREERERFVNGDQDTLGPLAEQFVSLGEALTIVEGGLGVGEVLERIVHAARAVVGADVVSVTLRLDGGFTTPVETDPVASKADAVQYEHEEGPCVEATVSPGLGYALSADLRHDSRWARFGPAAADLGLHSVLATGMFPRDARPRMGALNYYSRTPGGLDEADKDVALVFATHAAVALKGAQAVEAAELRSTQLAEAVQSRDVIGQAKGILMERRGLTADEAFDTLRRTSQDLNVKLRDLAKTLAEHRSEL
ncbi:GAF and ANTAR domain-containing protein [Actinomycetospora endophytica]|uniref:GAF and ANTAR domain-containing protein n=1 Tax=Actinomycetospora endophytica TaxID=2291215 RepID=A0ABS8PF89_9PSEU|nr:GAF and ANTAR domain-containing protein [Actinomycetospora endophytica]MCD2196612.1 GAF and ANTAR domain-containing protein [Actinomycetospora endophytica]